MQLASRTREGAEREPKPGSGETQEAPCLGSSQRLFAVGFRV